MEPTQILTFEFTIEEVNQIFEALADLPFEEVCELEQSIENQLWAQMKDQQDLRNLS